LIKFFFIQQRQAETSRIDGYRNARLKTTVPRRVLPRTSPCWATILKAALNVLT
jgi:hypothetical protein